MNEDDNDDDDDDGIPEMLGDLYTSAEACNGPMFARVLEEAKRELYAGCANFSRFSFLVKLLHIKTYYWISNTTFTAILKLLSLALPACNELPSSYNEAKKYLRELGLGYDSIHVCKNNCVLFRKEYEKSSECPVCGESRWKDSDGRKRVPQKVLRHFPLIPRLKRMFV